MTPNKWAFGAWVVGQFEKQEGIDNIQYNIILYNDKINGLKG